MADANENKQAEGPAPKRNKDGFIPGQRVTQKEIAEYRNKQRKAAKK
ncbi:hypothetical protein R3F64_01270 [Halomonas sp. 5021]